MNEENVLKHPKKLA